MFRGGGSFTWISNNVGPQIPVISKNVPDLTARDVYVSVAPVRGAVPIHARRWCSDSEDSDDDLLPVGALIPLDRPAVCCAQLDDFGWEAPDCVPGMLLSEQESDLEWTEQDGTGCFAGRVSGCVCRGGCCAMAFTGS